MALVLSPDHTGAEMGGDGLQERAICQLGSIHSSTRRVGVPNEGRIERQVLKLATFFQKGNFPGSPEP